MIDQSTPVLVGVGQVTQRVDDLTTALEPVDLLAEASRAAARDAGGSRSVLDLVDTIAVSEIISWRYPDPAALLARRLGMSPQSTMLTYTGGNSPQLLVGCLADEVARGLRRAVLIGGVECMSTRLRARREPKVWLPWTQADDAPCAEMVGDPTPGTTQYEMTHLAAAPIQIYPLFETALRARAGEGVDEHQARVGDLWSTFAEVASRNEHAWTRVAYTAAEVASPAPDNRIVAFPYLKRMCAILEVDQAAALLLCSYGAARDAGVADDRMVFPWSAADAHDHYHFSERDALHASPAIAVAGRAAISGAGVGIDDVARFDLYSCFPSAVQMAMDALGLRGPSGGDDRPLTLTGGLCFFGGPGNNYVAHSIASMVEACRGDPESLGMVTGLGWYVTKHSIGVYGATPPPRGFTRADAATLQAQVDALPRREVAIGFEGAVTVEATAVVYERDGTPNVAIVAGLTGDGRRTLANTRDPALMTSMATEPWEGRTIVLRTDGSTSTLVP